MHLYYIPKVLTNHYETNINDASSQHSKFDVLSDAQPLSKKTHHRPTRSAIIRPVVPNHSMLGADFLHLNYQEPSEHPKAQPIKPYVTVAKTSTIKTNNQSQPYDLMYRTHDNTVMSQKGEHTKGIQAVYSQKRKDRLQSAKPNLNRVADQILKELSTTQTQPLKTVRPETAILKQKLSMTHFRPIDEVSQAATSTAINTEPAGHHSNP